MEENGGRPRPQVRRKTSLKCTLKTKAVPHGQATRKKSDLRPPKLLLGLTAELQTLKLRRVQQSSIGDSSSSPEINDEEHLHTPSTWKLKFNSRSSPNLTTLFKMDTATAAGAKMSSQISQEKDKVRGSKPALAKKPVIPAKTPSPPVLTPDAINSRKKLTSISPCTRTPPIVPTKPKVREKPKGSISPGLSSSKDKLKACIDILPTHLLEPSPKEVSPEPRKSKSNFSKMKAMFENQSESSTPTTPRGKSVNCSPPVTSRGDKSPVLPPVTPPGDQSPNYPGKSLITQKVTEENGDQNSNTQKENSNKKNPEVDRESVPRSQIVKGNRSSDSSAYDDVMISDGSDSESGKVRVTVTSGNLTRPHDFIIGDTDSGHGSTISTDEAGIVPNLDGTGEGTWSEWVDETPPSPTKLHPQLRHKGRSSVSQRHSTDLSTRRTRRGSAPKSRFWSNPERTINVLSTSPSDDYDDVILPGMQDESKEWETESETSDIDKSGLPVSLANPEPEESMGVLETIHPSPMEPVEEDATDPTPLPEPPPKPPRSAIDIPILPPPRRNNNKTSPYGSPKLSPRESPYPRRDSPRVSPRGSPNSSPYAPRRKISLDSSIPAPLLPGISRSRDGSIHSDYSGSSGDARPESPPPALPRRRTGAVGDNGPAPTLPARQKTTSGTERPAPPIPPRDQNSTITLSVPGVKHEGTPPPTPPRQGTVRPADLKPDTIVPLSPEAREAALKEKAEQSKPKLPPRRKTVDNFVPPSLSTLTNARPKRSQSTTNLRTQEPGPALSPCDNSMLGEVPPPPPVRARTRAPGDDYVGPDPPLPEAPPIPSNGGYLIMNSVRPQAPNPRPPKTENYIDPSEIDSIPFNPSSGTSGTSGTLEPFRDLWVNIPKMDDEANYLTILPAEDEDATAAFEVERSSSKRFVDEPLYQIYHCGAVARDVLVQHHDDEDSQGDPDLYHDYSYEDEEGERSDSPSDIYNTWEELANSTPSPAVMASKLQTMIKTSTGVRTLWCEMPEVRNSGILVKMTAEEKRFQEALFEVITSEASYLKSLNLLISHFKTSPKLQPPLISKTDRHVLFSNIEAVRDVSEQFMNELEEMWQENFIVKASLCDIISKYASGPFHVYVKYCSNLTYQERRLKELKSCSPGFCEALQQLERDSACHSLPMQSFLSSPMQRITRFPLLVDCICHRMQYTDSLYRNVAEALQNLQKLVRQCNEGARQMENLEKITKIDSSLYFKNVKKMALVSQGRFLVKSGNLTHILKEAEGLLIKKKKENLHLCLFNDILIITKKKSEGVYQVIDYASRIHCHADFVEDEEVAKLIPHGLPTSCRHVFVMALLENHEKQPRDFFFSCESESERMRWVEAVTPAQQVTDDEKIYEEWACPQVQAIHRYVATEPDELTLEESDIVNVFRKMKDGWYEGERMRDGERGWFPANHTMEVQSERVRSRNLLQRYRLLTLHTNPTSTGVS